MNTQTCISQNSTTDRQWHSYSKSEYQIGTVNTEEAVITGTAANKYQT